MTTIDIDPLTVLHDYVPVLDLSGIRRSCKGANAALLAHAIANVCETSGFFVITNHGVDPVVIEEAYTATKQFFALPAAHKERYEAAAADPLMRGFGRQGNLAAGDGTGDLALPDLSETFTINRLGEPQATGLPDTQVDGIDSPNIWPDVPGFKEAYLAYYREMEVLARRIMSLFAIGLELPSDWFDDYLADHMTNLTSNYYPPQNISALKGQLRKGVHSDWGALTILYQDSDIGGLQVLDRAQNWLTVPAIPGTFVINIGDMMARWTNNKWVSTVHRVVNPPEELRNTERYSIPFFFQPRFDAVIDCIPTCGAQEPKYSPTKSGDYLLGRLAAAYDLAH